MSEQQLFFQNILENMRDGVMTLEGEGRITMFNQAAADILGVKRETVIDKGFAEVFMMEMEGNDTFNQAILDAVYQSGVGSTTLVDFVRPDGNTVHLTVTSSYLSPATGGEEGDRAGVIVVFNDITEVQKLRNAEKELNKQLIDACRKAEESNVNLNTALRKVQVVRIMTTVFVIILFFGLGFYHWHKKPGNLVARGNPPVRQQTTGADSSFLVRGNQVSTSVSLSGSLAPLEKINVTAPFNATVEKIFFQYGAEVKQGDLLVLLETSEFEVSVRNAEADYIKALQNYNGLKDWQSSNEMSRSKRTLMKAHRNLDARKRKLKESQLLFDRGIVSGNELEAAKEAVQNSELEQKAAEEDMATVQNKGNATNVKVAEMALLNARTKKESLEEKLVRKEIRAPESGVIMLGTSGAGNKQVSHLEKGSPVKEGDILLAVGNLDGMSVMAEVDEIDVGKIKIGQDVTITGEAFPGVCLAGKVSSVATQAKRAGMSGVPTFEVVVIIQEIGVDPMRKIRLGMTATLEVNVYENKAALMVPIDSVEIKDGRAMVTVRDKSTGATRQVEVKTGATTISSVEIVSGIQEGDELLVNQPADQ